LIHALLGKKLRVTSQYPIQVTFRNICVGKFYTDILVNEKVIVELKTVNAIIPEHEAQIINYLNATGIEVGLLINFGHPKLEYRRYSRKIGEVKNQYRQDELDSIVLSDS